MIVMLVSVNGKTVRIDDEDFCDIVHPQSCCLDKYPFNKMDKLIDAIKDIKAAIDAKEHLRYRLVKEDDSIKLVGNDGSVSSVVDTNTSYLVSIEDRVITVRGSDNSVQRIELPSDSDTEYGISFSNDILTLDSSKGEEASSNVDLSKFADDADIDAIMNNAVNEDDINNLFPPPPEPGEEGEEPPQEEP